MRAHPTLRRLVLAAAAALALGACMTPTIPLPPPSMDNMSFHLDAAAGTATFTYGPDPVFAGLLVTVLNVDEAVAPGSYAGVIVTARSDGSVGPTPPFPGQPGDRVRITFANEDDVSGRCVILTEGTPYVACP